MKPQRLVLAVTRSVNSTARLLDLVPELLADLRVQVLFTMPEDASAFDDGTLDLLRSEQARIVPWEQALGVEFDLVLSASYKGDLEQVRGPLLILPHGAGFGKWMAVPPGGRIPISAAAPAPSTMVLCNPEDEAHFKPLPAGTRLLVAGDPSFDRLQASVPSRGRYRKALDLTPDLRLVLISSTWGGQSLAAEGLDLADKLLASLPYDEFRVAIALHPNVWFGHGTWQVRTWLRRAIDAGLLVLSPEDAWRGGLVAADLVIGDHGSVTFYAAALGKPILLGSRGGDEVLSATPTGALMETAPCLDPLAPLLLQVSAAIEERDPHLALGARMFDPKGQAVRLLRREAYRLMRFDEPPIATRVLAVDQPETEIQEVRAFRVVAEFDGPDELTLQRYPAALKKAGTPPPPRKRKTSVTCWSATTSPTGACASEPRSSSIPPYRTRTTRPRSGLGGRSKIGRAAGSRPARRTPARSSFGSGTSGRSWLRLGSGTTPWTPRCSPRPRSSPNSPVGSTSSRWPCSPCGSALSARR